MKKSLILSYLLGMMSVCAMAQLSIDSLGVIKTYPPFYLKGLNSSNYSAIVSGSQHALCIQNNGTGLESNGYVIRYGLYVSNYLTNGKTNIGIMVYPKTDQSTNANEYGIVSHSGNSSYGNYSVCGLFHSPSSVTCGAGILGSTTTEKTIPAEYRDKYAGFFNGKVRVVNGSLTANVITPSASMLMRGSGDIRDIQTISDLNVAERLRQVQVLEVTRVEKEDEEDSESLPVYVDEEAGVIAELKNESQKKPSAQARTGYSLDAAQLREVYPELVYEDKNGNIGINYVEMVPLLVQAINELKAEVESLKQNQK